MKSLKGKSLGQLIRENWILLVPYVIFIVITAVIAVLNPGTLGLGWIANKSDAAFSLILVSIGQTLVLLIGGFDLSVGGVICVTNCLSAVYMGDSAGGMLLWSGVCILFGIAVGMFNGFVIGKTSMQPFIVTLATQSVCYGIALLILKVDGGNVSETYTDLFLTRFGEIPLSLILILLLILLWWYVKRTDFGISIYAVGSNEKAARLNGISVLRTKVTVYGLSGFFAALAGLFRTAQVASGSPTAGMDFVMISISAAVIGGTSLLGGTGGLVGTIVGAFVLKGIADLLVFLNVSSYWSSLFQGLLLILAVAISSIAALHRKGEAA